MSENLQAPVPNTPTIPRPLTFREQEILKVPPIIWDNLIGSIIYDLNQVMADGTTAHAQTGSLLTYNTGIQEVQKRLLHLSEFLRTGKVEELDKEKAPKKS